MCHRSRRPHWTWKHPLSPHYYAVAPIRMRETRVGCTGGRAPVRIGGPLEARQPAAPPRRVRPRRLAPIEMIPLRDENPSQSKPVVTWFLVAANVIVFLGELMIGPDLSPFFYDWALVPARLTLALEYGNEPVLAPLLTLISSMFLHGGWLHLLGNMWYLWIFGDNVEDRLGHVRFLLFYLAAGIVAGLLHWATNSASRGPTVGASGAIAGVLGAYLVAFPRARIITLLPFFPFIRVVALPAVLVLGLWFVLQFFSGALTLAYGGSGGGVAWWAHIGGFAFGILGMLVYGLIRRPEPSRAWVE